MSTETDTETFNQLRDLVSQACCIPTVVEPREARAADCRLRAEIAQLLVRSAESIHRDAAVMACRRAVEAEQDRHVRSNRRKLASGKTRGFNEHTRLS